MLPSHRRGPTNVLVKRDRIAQKEGYARVTTRAWAKGETPAREDDSRRRVNQGCGTEEMCRCIRKFFPDDMKQFLPSVDKGNVGMCSTGLLRTGDGMRRERARLPHYQNHVRAVQEGGCWANRWSKTFRNDS
jgi:hypothetical protein